jgi:hypothetical protein
LRARPVQTGLDHRGAKAERAIIAGHRERPEQQRRAPRPGLDRPQPQGRDEPRAVIRRERQAPRGKTPGAQLLASFQKTRRSETRVEQLFARENIVRRFVVDDEAGGRESRVGRGLKGKIKGHLCLHRKTSDPRASRWTNQRRPAGTGRTKGFSRLSPARARKTAQITKDSNGAKPLKQIEE